MYTYTIKESAEDFRDSVITKSNITADFTLREVEADANRLRKALVELKAKLGLEQAKIVNIESFHPSVKDMGDEERFTIHMYEEAKQVTKIAERKIKEIEEALLGYENELKDINTQLGVPVDLKQDVKEENK